MGRPTNNAGPFARLVTQPALYYAIRTALTLPGLAGVGPSTDAARVLGRKFGAAPFNRTRVERAMGHIAQAMPEASEEERRALALRSYEHLFELGVELASVSRNISEDAWCHHMRLEPIGPVMDALFARGPVIMITGHCGNWEVLGYTLGLLGFKVHGIYRPLDLPALDSWVRQSRSRRGLMLVDKFGALQRLPELIETGAVAVVADQNAGDRGVFVPYFGRLTSTYKSVGLLALQTRATIICGYGLRLPRGQGDDSVRKTGALDYSLGYDDLITPEEYESAPDPLFYITARYRRSIERMVRRAPEQYLWMHRIWKSRPRHERLNQPFPANLERKLRELPWMTEEELDAIKDRSERDRAFLTEHGLRRMP